MSYRKLKRNRAEYITMFFKLVEGIRGKRIDVRLLCKLFNGYFPKTKRLNPHQFAALLKMQKMHVIFEHKQSDKREVVLFRSRWGQRYVEKGGIGPIFPQESMMNSKSKPLNSTKSKKL